MKKHTEKDLVVFLKVTDIWQTWNGDQIPIFGTICSLSPQELPWSCWLFPLFPLRKTSKGKVPGLIQIVEFEFEGDGLLPSVSVLCNPFDSPGSSWSTTEGVSQQVCLPKKTRTSCSDSLHRTPQKLSILHYFIMKTKILVQNDRT